MHVHPNARTTYRTRHDIVRRLGQGVPVLEVARAFGVSATTVRKWRRRFQEEGPSGLQDRRSTPRSCPHRTAPAKEAEVGRLRRLRLLMRAIARRVRLALSTVAAVLKRQELSRLPPLEPPPVVRRYERKRPGELLHVDIKKLGRFREIGHRIDGRRHDRNRGAGWEHVHVCVDDHTRLAYVEVLPDEGKETACAFLERAVAWYRSKGVQPERVLSDNGSAYRSKLWRKTCERLGLKPKRTRPYTPRTNGKAERFIQTLVRSWAYERPYSTSGYRRQGLPYWLRRYNEQRPHHGIGGLTPLQRLRQATQ